MHPLVLLLGLLLILFVLWDAFETVVLPRTVTRRWRLARIYFRSLWSLWRHASSMVRGDARRERFLAVYGPLSLLGVVVLWASGIIVGFAAVHWGLGSSLQPLTDRPSVDDIYMSASTFFTLGLGDVQPVGYIARFVTVSEAGTGFAFLAVVIAYLPVLYQSFSRREVRITLLDAWAGSPPAAAEILRRLAIRGELSTLDPFLRDWEYWCSELLESHISYPTVAFFRSQHQRQSWVSALATVLDVSALVLVGVEGVATWQARVTFAIARHAAVDLTQVLNARPSSGPDRLPVADLETLRVQLEEAGLRPARSPEADRRLLELRVSYEPYILGLAGTLLMPAPSWFRQGPAKDNWQTSPRGMDEAHL